MVKQVTPEQINTAYLATVIAVTIITVVSLVTNCTKEGYNAAIKTNVPPYASPSDRILHKQKQTLIKEGSDDERTN